MNVCIDVLNLSAQYVIIISRKPTKWRSGIPAEN
jgi:hypothetical protein